jgi:hypothetical protein
MVDDPRGGVIYVGGGTFTGSPNVLYRLRHADQGANWEALASKIVTPRVWHSAFLVPDDLADCSPI